MPDPSDNHLPPPPGLAAMIKEKLKTRQCRCSNPMVVECRGDNRRLDYYCKQCGKNYHPDPTPREPDRDRSW